MANTNTLAAKLAIRDALLALVEANQQFKAAVLNDIDLPVWIMEGVDNTYDRNKAATIAAQLTYTKEQNRQETAKCVGIVGISTSTLATGIELNKRKDAFKKAMRDYRTLFGQSFSMTSLSSQEIRETLLGNLKLQHLHFVQSYRHIKLFATPPARIGFSWAVTHTGAVRLPAQKALAHLKSKFTQSQGLQADIQIIESLPEHTEIVIKRPLTSHMRANITWPDDIEHAKQQDSTLRSQYPSQVNTPLPLFICLEANAKLPEFNRIKPLDKQARQARLQRKDARLKKLSNRPGSLIYTTEI